jgi:hypothetical protein
MQVLFSISFADFIFFAIKKNEKKIFLFFLYPATASLYANGGAGLRQKLFCKNRKKIIRIRN